MPCLGLAPVMTAPIAVLSGLLLMQNDVMDRDRPCSEVGLDSDMIGQQMSAHP